MKHRQHYAFYVIHGLEQPYPSVQSCPQDEKKTVLRNKINGLLIIIGNLKHYLGDYWQTILPGGVEDVDLFLKKVDTNHVLDTDTWSRYEPVDDQDTDEETQDGTIHEEKDIFF